MTDQTVNVPLLRKAVEWAEAEAMKPPELSAWEQMDYVSLAEQSGCGTAYCVAGWVLHEAGWSDEQINDAAALSAESPQSAAASAAALLGIPIYGGGDGSPLFSAFNSIEDVRRIAEEIAGERL